MDYLLSRHPIFKAGIHLSGYEIRSRAVGINAISESAESEAESAMFAMLSEAGLDQIGGTYPCVIGVTPENLISERWKAIQANQLVLGYFNDFSPEDDVGQKLRDLIGSGVRVALSGELRAESLQTFSDRIHSIKLDVTRFAPDDLERRFQELRPYKAPLLAGRVDTLDDLEFCQSLGFDLYEGRFISRVVEKDERQIPVNRLAMMRVLSQLQNPEQSMAELERTIFFDPALTYRLLTYVNSAAVALPCSVSSVGHALRLVGLDRLRAWASVLLLASVDDKPRELITIALVRARMCERLSQSVKNADKEAFFSAGLLSVIDALLDCPMEKAIAELPLIEDIKSALVSRIGPAGQALRCAVAYESADWDNVQFYGVAPAVIRDSYVEAIAFARNLTTGMLS